MKTKSFLFLLLFTVQALVAQAQTVSQWGNLNRLKAGKKIAVHLKPGGEIKGKLICVESEELLAARKNEKIRFKKEDIKFITAAKAFLGKKVWIGATIGFDVGSAYGAHLSSAISQGYGTFGDHLGATVGFGMLGATADVVISGIGSGGEESWFTLRH